MKRLFILAFLFILLFATAREQKEQFILKPIGKVSKIEKSTKLILKKKYEPALQGLDKNSHVWVLWWFDRNDTVEKRSILQVHPCGNPENPLTGVFACRSPYRPNLIALSLCRILSVENNIVELEKIDAFDETPILDLKPYIPGYDSADDAVTSKSPHWDRRVKKKKFSLSSLMALTGGKYESREGVVLY